MARPEGSPIPSSPPSSPDRLPRLSRRSLLKGGAAVAGVAVANELTRRPLLPSGAEAHEVIPREPQSSLKPVKSTSPLDDIIQKGAEAAQSGIGAIRKELASLAGKPAAAHGLDEKNAKSNRAAVTERRVMELRPSSVINNVETWGHEQALSDTEMRQLIENLNAKVGALSPEERAATMRNDTYYGTMFISETAYGAFLTDNSETFQTFLKWHEIEMRRMLKDGKPSIVPNMTDPTRDEKGFVMKRVIVVRDGVEPPGSHHLGYLSNGIKDSDGAFNIPHPQIDMVNGAYQPTISPYWNLTKRIDYGLLHEMSHRILHLYDEYAFEVRSEFDTITENLKSRLPIAWHRYPAKSRQDISPNDIMASAGNTNFWHYSSYLLHRRNGQQHNLEKFIPETGTAPYEFPNKIAIKLFDSRNNSQIAPADVRMYRSKGNGKPYYGKDITDDIIYQGTFRDFSPSLLFTKNSQGNIELTEGTLLMFIRDANGKEYFRWMDVRDFNLAHWTTGNAGVVTMDMKVLATDDTITTPESFDWTIRSSTKRSLIPIIPRIFGGLSN